ncbi:hypothetical protein ILUMI_18649 [Ignelater luminosus]|uniref:Uncharacterized protein n=1 Tax=Ignelater luminosus TaxID=2038154 RepID=A0A8K0CJI1_IGNLU|nr:hypothetical protein ILUMI_18649 [Ignelater luminosus]
MGNLDIMKTRFNDQVNTLKSKKGKNHQLFTKDDEEDLEVILKDQSDTAPQNVILANDIDGGIELSVSLDVDNSTADLHLATLTVTVKTHNNNNTADKENNVNVEQDDEDNKNGSSLKEIPQRIQEIRDSAKQSLENQADKMLKRSNAKFTVAKVS